MICPRACHDRRIRSITSRPQESRDAIRAPKAHSAARPITSAGPTRRAIRIHVGSDRTEPQAVRQADSASAAGHVWNLYRMSVAVRACSPSRAAPPGAAGRTNHLLAVPHRASQRCLKSDFCNEIVPITEKFLRHAKWQSPARTGTTGPVRKFARPWRVPPHNSKRPLAGQTDRRGDGRTRSFHNDAISCDGEPYRQAFQLPIA